MNINLRSFLMVVAGIVFLSVGVFAQGEGLTGRWKLTQINGGAVLSGVSLEIRPGQRRFTGDAGCNAVFGNLQVGPNRVRFLSVGSTRKLCSDRRVMSIETDFISALRRVDRFRRAGNVLNMYSGNRLILKFSAFGRPVAEPAPGNDARLENRVWRLESIARRKVGPEGAGAFLSFDPVQGSAGGNSSCNLFGGSYTAMNNTIKITEIVSTMRACIEDERMDIERDFLDGLRHVDRYEIKGENLYLYSGSRTLLTFNGTKK